MNHVEIAAALVRAEVAGHPTPEWLAGAAMCLVQNQVRRWREFDRIAAGAGFTNYAPAILASGSGYCGSTIIAWRAILEVLGFRSRQIEVYWDETGHVIAEAFWDDRWHLFDVQGGATWIEDGEVLDFEHVLGHPDEGAVRVFNAASLRYSWTDLDRDPFTYLHVKPLTVKVIPEEALT